MTVQSVGSDSHASDFERNWPGRGRRRLIRAAGTVAVTGVLLAACGGSVSRGSSGTTTTTAPASSGGPAEALQNAFIAAVNKVRPSVVEISTSEGLGSGVVYDRSGDIVTNAHVVGTARQFEVTLSDGRTLAASLIGSYAADDLAVIKVGGSELPPPASFADSSKVVVGEMVLAVGNPLGLASSVTDGIVSFNGRTVAESNGAVLPATIQTSAPINPGNSGGALIDLDARVIGIPTLVAGDTQTGTAVNGIGFAIPANTVRFIADQLVSTGRVTNTGRAALGIRAATAFSSSGETVGVAVVSVDPGGPAAAAGIQDGDLITSVDGHSVTSLADLADAMASIRPGARVSVVVQRAGAKATVAVTVEALSAG